MDFILWFTNDVVSMTLYGWIMGYLTHALLVEGGQKK